MHTPPADAARDFGLGRGRVYPADRAGGLLNPLRRLLHPPARLVRRLDPAPSDVLLEVGPGPGWFSRALAARVPDGSLHLLDLQEQMVTMALSRASSDVVVGTAGDAAALPFADGSFDAVAATAVLGEIPDPRAALGEFARVLRPGGRLLTLETRTDPDFIAHRRLVAMAAPVGLHPHSRHGRLLGYTAVLRRGAR